MSEEIKELLFLLHNDKLTEAGKRKLEQEIERLNNILNELEKYLIEQAGKSYSNDYDNALDKLDELKGEKE